MALCDQDRIHGEKLKMEISKQIINITAMKKIAVQLNVDFEITILIIM